MEHQAESDEMADLVTDFAIPPEVQNLLDSGFLSLLSRDDATKTVEFSIPSLRSEDSEGRITTFTLTWIHPDFNAQYCHYYSEKPGDGPNFHIMKDTTDVGDELLDIATVSDLIAWLQHPA